MKNLQELTGKESGIVIYDSKEGILCNWSSDDGLPRIFVTGLIFMAEEIPKVEGEHTDDLGTYLNGIEVYICAEYDEDEEISSGTVYKLSDDMIVIAPDDWA